MPSLIAYLQLGHETDCNGKYAPNPKALISGQCLFSMGSMVGHMGHVTEEKQLRLWPLGICISSAVRM